MLKTIIQKREDESQTGQMSTREAAALFAILGVFVITYILQINNNVLAIKGTYFKAELKLLNLILILSNSYLLMSFDLYFSGFKPIIGFFQLC